MEEWEYPVDDEDRSLTYGDMDDDLTEGDLYDLEDDDGS